MQRLLAIFCALLLLQAVMPASFLIESGLSTEIKSPAGGNVPIAEEEEDENSDLELKFFSPPTASATPRVTIFFAPQASGGPDDHIEEIPHPPPLPA